MGCYKYMEELWRHKQSDALRFLLRVYVKFVFIDVVDSLTMWNLQRSR
jgi:hypothetical protein